MFVCSSPSVLLTAPRLLQEGTISELLTSIERLNSLTRASVLPDLKLGDFVERGPDWKWGSQDQSPGCLRCDATVSCSCVLSVTRAQPRRCAGGCGLGRLGHCAVGQWLSKQVQVSSGRVRRTAAWKRHASNCHHGCYCRRRRRSTQWRMAGSIH